MISDLRHVRDYFEASAVARGDATANLYLPSVGPELTALYDHVASELLDLLRPAPGWKVLDIGCGTGELLSRIASACPDIVGVDLSPAMASIVVSKGHRALAYDGGALPFEDGAFDLALIYQVIINLPDAPSARSLVQEALRVTRSGGKVLLGAVPHPAWSGFPTHRIAWWVRAKISARRLLFGQNGVPYFSYDPALFEQMFEQRLVAKVSYASCGIMREGWNTKYHVILTKA